MAPTPRSAVLPCALGSLRNRQRCGVGSLFLGFPVARLGSVSRLYTADAPSTSAASGCGLENRDQSRQAVGARIARAILDRLWGWKLAPSCHNHDPKIVEFIWESPINGECGSRNGWTEEVYRSKRSGRAIPLAAGPDRHFNLKERFCCRFAVEALTINNRCYCWLQLSGTR